MIVASILSYSSLMTTFNTSPLTGCPSWVNVTVAVASLCAVTSLLFVIAISVPNFSTSNSVDSVFDFKYPLVGFSSK